MHLLNGEKNPIMVAKNNIHVKKIKTVSETLRFKRKHLFLFYVDHNIELVLTLFI